MTDRRRYRRYTVNCVGHLCKGKLRKYEFQINNISAVGMSITTDLDFDQASLLSMSISLTGLPLPRERQLKGEVVMKKRLKAAFFKYSIHFVELTNADVVELDEFLRYMHNNTFNTSIMLYDDHDRMLT